MDKIATLKFKAIGFRTLLEQHQATEPAARDLLTLLTPLFDEIARGAVVPPTIYRFRRALGREHPFYEPGNPFGDANADFAAALEDWDLQR